MERVVLAVVLVALAAGLAAILRRRANPADRPIRTGYTVPEQLDRRDFVRPEAPWLVVEFSSRTCLSCAGTWEKVAILESTEVAVQDVPHQDAKELHDRYGIEAVPMVLVADAEGVVRTSFVGPPSAADLWSALAELREN